MSDYQFEYELESNFDSEENISKRSEEKNII